MADGVKVNVGLDASALNTGLAKLNSSFGAMREQLKGITGLAGKLNVLNGAFDFIGKLTAPLGALKDQIASAFDVAGQAEQTRTSFKVLIGSVEETTQVLGQLKKLADTSPYGDQEINDAAKSLLAFGQSAGTVAQTLTTIGDIASGVGAPIGEISEIFGKARVQGTLFAEDINQLTGRGINVLDSFAAQLGVGVEQVKKMGSEGKINFGMLEKAFQDMTARGGKFNGMMAQQSGTFNGLKSTLLAGWDAVKVEFATPIMDSLKPLMQFAIEKLGGMKTAAKDVGSSIAEWGSYIRGAFEKGNAVDAIIQPLKLGLLEAANFFAIKMANVLAEIKIGFEMVKPFKSLEERSKAIGEIQTEAILNKGPFEQEIKDVQDQLSKIRAQGANAQAADMMRNSNTAQQAAGNAFIDSVSNLAGKFTKDNFQVAPSQTQSSKNEEENRKMKEEEERQKKLAQVASKIKDTVVSDAITKIGGGGFVGTSRGTTEERIARASEKIERQANTQTELLKEIRDKKPVWQ